MFCVSFWVLVFELLTMPTRRQFLRSCSLIATAATLTPAAALSQNRGLHPVGGNDLRFDRFAAQLNTAFNVPSATGALILVLVEARLAPPTAPNAEDARNERFSLRFRGPVHTPLGQDTYLFEHPRLGRQPIFIVPVPTPDGTQCYYEAIFNHPVSPRDWAAQVSRAPQGPVKN